MIFKRLSIAIGSNDFWTSDDSGQQTRFINAIERGVNHTKHVKMAERLIPDDVKEMLEDVPVMLMSLAVEDAVHEFADYHYRLRDADYDIGAMFACHPKPDYCGIVIPVERLHDARQLRESVLHEIVHYEQWKRGDFKADPEHRGLLWKGELYENDYVKSSDVMTFSDKLKWEIENLPWEKEAYGACDQMCNAGRGERELYYWLCDYYCQEPEDYDAYWGRMDGTISKKVFDCNSNTERAIDACNVIDNVIYDNAGFDDPNAHIPNLVSAAYGHPSQPVEVDANGIKRFKPNKIISDLCDAGKLDLNHIATTYSDEDKCQFNQLIGYSVDSWWYLTSSNMVAKSKARIEEMRHVQNSSLDGEINYIRKGDDITSMIGIKVTLEGDMYDIPLALPILLQRMNNYDGHYNLRRNDSADTGYEVEWVDSSFQGHCSYDLDKSTSNEDIPEFPVHDINMKIYKDFIWLEEIADPSSGNKVLTFDWKAMTAAFLPTDGSEVNLGISKLLTRYFTYTKDNVDLQGVYMLSQSALRFYDARERVLKLLDDPAFNAEQYLDVDFTGLVEALLIGPVKNNTAVNQMLMVKKTKGVAKQIQSLLNQMNQSMVIFESGKIHLETDHAKYDADLGELEKLIKQYL